MSAKADRIYCEVVFYRSQGLGNRLFPWARCRVFSWLNDAPMLAPRWCLPRIGPLRRRQVRLRDFPRQSLLCAQFTPTGDMIKGSRRAAIRRRATVVPEPQELDPLHRGDSLSGERVVRFTGIGPKFAPLEGWDTRLREELLRSMTSRDRQLAARTEGSVIGVHVRRGDFFVVPDADLASWEGPHGALQTPTQWFVESINLVRDLLGHAAPVFVVSDGEPDDLVPLLRLDDVTLLRGGSPISDLLALSNAQVLVGSMESSFTAWASFLGQMTTCRFPAPSEQFTFVNRKGRYTGVLEPGADIPGEFMRDLRLLQQ